jgi:hypothetical protein
MLLFQKAPSNQLSPQLKIEPYLKGAALFLPISQKRIGLNAQEGFTRWKIMEYQAIGRMKAGH